MLLLNLPRVSLAMFLMSFLLLIVWLKPLKTIAYMLTKTQKSPSKHHKKRRSTSSSASSSTRSEQESLLAKSD